MKNLKNWLFFGLALLVVSCASVSTSFDYDKTEDFTKFKTYQWVQETGATNNLSKNPFLEKAIYAAIQTTLKTKGYTYQETGDTDFGIALQTQEQQETQVTTTGWGGAYGGWGAGYYRPWVAGAGTTNIDVDNYTEGTLIIDVIDMANKQLAWRGMGTKVVGDFKNDEKGQQMVQDNINSILTNFPPPPAASK